MTSPLTVEMLGEQYNTDLAFLALLFCFLRITSITKCPRSPTFILTMSTSRGITLQVGRSGNKRQSCPWKFETLISAFFLLGEATVFTPRMHHCTAKRHHTPTFLALCWALVTLCSTTLLAPAVFWHHKSLGADECQDMSLGMDKTLSSSSSSPPSTLFLYHTSSLASLHIFISLSCCFATPMLPIV